MQLGDNQPIIVVPFSYNSYFQLFSMGYSWLSFIQLTYWKSAQPQWLRHVMSPPSISHLMYLCGWPKVRPHMRLIKAKYRREDVWWNKKEITFRVISCATVHCRNEIIDRLFRAQLKLLNGGKCLFLLRQIIYAYVIFTIHSKIMTISLVEWWTGGMMFVSLHCCCYRSGVLNLPAVFWSRSQMVCDYSRHADWKLV